MLARRKWKSLPMVSLPETFEARDDKGNVIEEAIVSFVFQKNCENVNY